MQVQVCIGVGVDGGCCQYEYAASVTCISAVTMDNSCAC